VRPDQTLDVDLLPDEAGSTVEFSEVLLVGGNGAPQIGNPLVEGARVVAEVLERGRDRKVLVFKYKNKTRYRRRHGHRQDFTRLAIRQILVDGRELKAPEEEEKKKPARPTRKRAAPKAKAEPVAAEAEAITKTTPQETGAVAEATPKPKRAARPKKAAAPKAKATADEVAGPEEPKRARRPRKTEAKD
jgi:large subunit ribosomal protein L21